MEEKKITAKYLNGTDYANIYGIIEDGEVVGTVECKIAGRECGKVYFDSWKGKYGKRDIRRFWKEHKNEAIQNRLAELEEKRKAAAAA